uniref:Uncharacterized protein n=1 Tax=Denticeps clupeoides TaxID=299321 RepID=A0AAY4C946_9TELE
MTPTVNSAVTYSMEQLTFTTKTVHFRSREEVKTQIHQRLLNWFQSLQPPCDKNRKESILPQLNCPVQLIINLEKSPVTSRLWRPW